MAMQRYYSSQSAVRCGTPLAAALITLVFSLQAASVTLIPQGAIWRYLDNGSDQGTAWLSPAFDDAGWNSGAAQLGYGDGDEATTVSYGPDPNNKYVTTYFRHRFHVADASAISSLTLELLRDDGAVVYLNGTEVVRYSMPTYFDYRTYATAASEYVWDAPVAIPPTLLVTGNNTLAVEVHQGNATSSDLSLDLRLTAEQLLPGTAPHVPALLAPADGISGVDLPPQLAVQVSDPDAGSLTVSFLGRKNVPAAPFSLVMLPDTQKYVTSSTLAPIFTQQTQWIVDNRGSLNIVAVNHVGDVADLYNDATQYTRANASLTLLDNAGVPYALLPGNHDQPTTLYNQFFPVSRYAGNPWFGGNYPADKYDNNVLLFSGGGLDFVLVQIEFWPGAATLAWADAVLKAHPDRVAILATHGFLDTSANRTVTIMGSTQYIWDELVADNPNVWFVLCGHMHGEARRTDTANGHPVHQLLADYQEEANGGNGWLRLMQFVPELNTVRVFTYSPYLDLWQIDANSEFELEFPMGGFEVLGTHANVPSGSTVTQPWPAAVMDTDYQWFVTVTDPTDRTTSGPVWSFSTSPVDLAPPQISNVTAVDITDRSARITWTTDEPADSYVDYGLDSSFGTTLGTEERVTQHSVDVTGLDANTLYTFQVRSMDASGNQAGFTDPTTVFTTLPPNEPPAAQPQSVSTPEDTGLDLILSASDDQPESLSYRITAGPSYGALDGTPPGLHYTPGPNFSGTDSFQFEASDGEFTSTATVTILVTPINDDPTAPVLSANPGNNVVVLSWTPSTDPEGANVGYELYRRVSGESQFSLLAGPMADLGWSDDTVLNGTAYEYLVRAWDNLGGFADSAPASAIPEAPDYNAYVIQNPAVTYGTVSGDYTTLAPDNPAAQTVTEQKIGLNGSLDVVYTLQTSATASEIATLTIRLACTYTDYGDPLRVWVLTHGAWTEVTASIANGEFPVPDPLACVDPSGLIQIRFTDSVSVRKEKLDLLTLQTLYAEVVVGSLPNRAPTPANDTATTLPDNPIVIDLLLNDSDPDGDLLVVAALPTTTPAGAALTDNGDGTITYTPAPGWTGVDTFTYGVSDGDLSATATVTVSVTEPPTEIDVFADSFEVSEWNGLWTEDSQNDWFRSSQRASDGSQAAEVDGSASNASLTSIPIDLQGRDNARISFDWLIESGLDNGEYLECRISTDGGKTWTVQAQLLGNVAPENTWHSAVLELTGISQLRLQFRGKMSDSAEDANVDNVRVVAY